MSKHPAVKKGSIEIRPVDDLTEMIRESERRRLRAKGERIVALGSFVDRFSAPPNDYPV
jgi:hypothetical protein